MFTDKINKKQLYRLLIASILLGFPIGALIVYFPIQFVLGFFSAIAFTIICFFRIDYALIIYIVLNPLFSTMIINLPSSVPDITFSRAAIVILIPAFLYHVIFSKMKLTGEKKIEFWMLAFSILSIISMLINYGSAEFLSALFHFSDCYIIPFIIFFLTRYIFSEKNNFNTITKILLIPTIYLSVMAIYEEMTLHDIFPTASFKYIYNSTLGHNVSTGLKISESGMIRANGPFEYPETYGIVLASLALITSYHMNSVTEKPNNLNISKYVSIFILILSVFGLYFNRVRSVWIGAAMAFFVRFGSFKRQRALMVIILVLLLIASCLKYENIKSTDVFKERITNVQTIYARIATINSAFRMFSDSPILGVGFNNFVNFYYSRKYTYFFLGIESLGYPHNTYLKILAENGILGFISFILILYYFLSYIKRIYEKHITNEEKRRLIPFFGVLIVYLLVSLSDTIGSFPNANVLFFFLMGILVAEAQKLNVV